MRIWMINHYALPPNCAGGTRHYHFAKQLMSRGHEVFIIAANFNHFSHTYISTNTDDVPFIWIPTPAYGGNTISRFLNMLTFSYRILKKKYLSHLKRPDIIIGSSPHLFSALSAEILARRFNVPFLLEIRDIWPDTLIELGRISKKHPLILFMKMIELHLYKRAKRIISLLPAAKDYFIQNGVNSKNIVWIPNAIDTDMIHNVFPYKPQQKFTIIYAGAHGLANDLDTVLTAAKILQNNNISDHIQILLIGEGPEKKRLKQRTIDENINIIEFLDSVPKKDIYTTLNKADIFLMLLKDSPIFRWGISPNKLFDYLIMGRPVIFGVNTPFNPIKEHKAGITIQPSDPESLANAIKELFSLSTDELMNMGLRGRNFVLKNHHVSYLTDLLENMINEI